MKPSDWSFDAIELRRYVTRPGMRDALIALFDREFTEGQEACGMIPFGHFRDLNDPDAFVWLRGFPRMDARRRALEAFYKKSQSWQDNRAVANATLLDNDNVLLLRNARPASGFDLSGLVRPGAGEGHGKVVVVAVLMLDQPASETFLSAFEHDVLARVRESAERATYLVTDPRPNDFPALPVREGEFAFVATGVCRDMGTTENWAHAFAARELPEQMRARIISSELLRLEPAARSIYGN